MGHLMPATFVHSSAPVLTPTLRPLPTSTTTGSTLHSNIPPPAHTSSSPPTAIGAIVPILLIWTAPGSLATAKADTLLILPTRYAQTVHDKSMPSLTTFYCVLLSCSSQERPAFPHCSRQRKRRGYVLLPIASHELLYILMLTPL